MKIIYSFIYGKTPLTTTKNLCSLNNRDMIGHDYSS